MRFRVIAAVVTVFLVIAMVHQFGWGTVGLVLAGFALLAAIGWALPVPKKGPHADAAGQGWRGPTI